MAKDHLPPPRNNRERLLKECWDREMTTSMIYGLTRPLAKAETIEAKEKLAGEILARLQSPEDPSGGTNDWEKGG